MPDDRTTVTELATALGMLGFSSVPDALRRPPRALTLDDATWARLVELRRQGSHADAFDAAFANGVAFLHGLDALRGRVPRLIEWTGGRRPPGDEVAPIDLRVDHVYLVSCKYLSANLYNVSPARLFDGLLTTRGSWDRGDWYARTAPDAYELLYQACRALPQLADDASLPDRAAALGPGERGRLREALRARHWPEETTAEAYRALCRTVSEESANIWRRSLDASGDAELVFWRLLRIGNAPYFLLGAEVDRPLRYRVATAWDWRQRYELRALRVEPATAGQPQVDWIAEVRVRDGRRALQVRGHVEVRWSHGRFRQPPEAKVYLDTPVDDLPGYEALET